MTKDEIRKLFAEAEEKIRTPEICEKIRKEFEGSGKAPAESREGLAIRLNRIEDREILVEVLSRILADK